MISSIMHSSPLKLADRRIREFNLKDKMSDITDVSRETCTEVDVTQKNAGFAVWSFSYHS